MLKFIFCQLMTFCRISSYYFYVLNKVLHPCKSHVFRTEYSRRCNMKPLFFEKYNVEKMKKTPDSVYLARINLHVAPYVRYEYQLITQQARRFVSRLAGTLKIPCVLECLPKPSHLMMDVCFTHLFQGYIQYQLYSSSPHYMYELFMYFPICIHYNIMLSRPAFQRGTWNIIQLVFT